MSSSGDEDDETRDPSPSDSDTDDGSPTQEVYDLALHRDYAPSWRPKHAFREFFQNWRDGMIESFRLDVHDMKPEIVKLDDRWIQITMFHTPSSESLSKPATRRTLGCILFNKRLGSVEITNFDAMLSPEYLKIGKTGKSFGNRPEGHHGEGFKIAALTLLREGFPVKFETNSMDWVFSLRPHLSCRILKSKATRAKKRKQYEKPRVKHERKRCIGKDMTVMIGRQDIKQSTTQKISASDFREWMKVSLDLDPPTESKIIRTTVGDIILDKSHLGRVYLKGILLEHADNGPDLRRYKFGYNFYEGDTDRDRKQTTDSEHEGKMLADIWEQALRLRGPDLFDQFISMFNEDKDYADVALVARHATSWTANKISAHLKLTRPKAFFYSERETWEREATTDEDIICKELRKKPVKLPTALWRLIRNCEDDEGYQLMESPLEERHYLFQISPKIQLPNDVFCRTIAHALKCSFASDPKLMNIGFEVVEGANTTIGLSYNHNKRLVLLHQDWFSFKRTHQASSCEYFLVSGDSTAKLDGFFCDHVVQDILELAFKELRVPLALKSREVKFLSRNAIQCLRQMPRQVRTVSRDAAGTLEVRWASNENAVLMRKYGSNVHYSVTLHKSSSCEARFRENLDCNEDGSVSHASTYDATSCACPTQIVPGTMSRAIFEGLSHAETYFPLVSREESGLTSFYGLPPPPIAPKAGAGNSGNSGSESRIAGNGHPGSTYASPEIENDTDEEMTDFSSEEEEHTSDESAAQEDEVLWTQWNRKELRGAFSQFTCSRTLPTVNDRFQRLCAPLRYEDIEFTFETHQYAWVQLEGQSAEYAIFIHDIVQGDRRSEVTYFLLVTKYSRFTFPPYSVAQPAENAIDADELVLHFTDFNKMKTPEDAEIIGVDDILSARSLETGRSSVRHCFKRPEIDGPFCRFAICSVAAVDTASLTPLAPYLVIGEEPWATPDFCNIGRPLTFEMSPGILGVSEGFSAQGFPIEGVFGLDETKPCTWQCRHASARPLDGSLLDVLNDFDKSTLWRSLLPDSTAPKVFLFASRDQYFRLSNHNRQKPSLQEFLGELSKIDQAVAEFGRNFYVTFLSPAHLHQSAITRFSETILKLLEKRLSVHLKLVPVRDYGAPQERLILVLVASPLCAPLPWKDDDWVIKTERRKNVREVIKDLRFENPRKSTTRLVCLAPESAQEASGRSITTSIYNHHTGLMLSEHQLPIPVHKNTLLDFTHGPQGWMHSERRDRLTIRELARIQGLPDDFKFWGDIDTQYVEVCNAIPPVITQMVAETIEQAVKDTMPMHISMTHRNKRVRVEIKEEDN